MCPPRRCSVYLRRVDDVTNGGLRWGILTSGRHWRLYFRGALSIGEDFLEIDLGKVLGLPGCERDLLDKRPDVFAEDDAWRSHIFKLFAVVFGRDAFLSDHRGETFHQLALRDGKQWEAKVARDRADSGPGSYCPARRRTAHASSGSPSGAPAHNGLVSPQPRDRDSSYGIARAVPARCKSVCRGSQQSQGPSETFIKRRRDRPHQGGIREHCRADGPSSWRSITARAGYLRPRQRRVRADVARNRLMWRTALPRMPLDPKEELRRLGFDT